MLYQMYVKSMSNFYTHKLFALFVFIINYSNIDADRIMDELLIIKDTIL
jgi:hypothetical protein